MTFAKAPPRPKRPREEGEFSTFTPKPRPVAVSSVERAPAEAVPKLQTFRSEKWLRAVASLPCVKCGREGMTQAAHRNQSKGMGIKTDDCLTAALCVACHALIDQGPTMTREERRSVMDLAILMTLVQLASKGLVRPA